LASDTEAKLEAADETDVDDTAELDDREASLDKEVLSLDAEVGFEIDGADDEELTDDGLAS
jgi:hypothetical protein